MTAFPIREKELALVKATAKQTGVSQAEVIRRAIMAYVGECPTCGRPFKKKGGKHGKTGK